VTSSRNPVLVVTGMAREARMAAGPDVITIGAGGSPSELRALLGGKAPACRAVVSFGIAAGLDPALKPGAIVVGSGVLAADQRWQSDPTVLRLWADRLRHAGSQSTMADIAGSETALLTPGDKSALRRATGAAAADMESHVAAEFATARGLPFAAIRVVCDPAERALPPLVIEAIRPDGRIDFGAIFRSLTNQPGQLGELPRLTMDAAKAFAALSRVRAALGPGLGLGGLRLGEAFGDVL
jgi:adenosylhomocysteine nucleosidase